MVDYNNKLSIIGNRKNHHIKAATQLKVESGFSDFNRIQLEHCALPELSLEKIDSSMQFLGKSLSMPLLISSTTGGTPDTYPIIRQLAEAAENNKIALCVGSQRIALEFPECSKYFQLRSAAPTIPILANLGAVQLNYGLGIEHCHRAIDMLEADGLVLHLNPLQECLQAGGNTDFSQILSKIETLVNELSIPIIIKEVGCGISLKIAQKLVDVGVTAIDISGSGGTSWALIESELAPTKQLRELARSFKSWGLPTVSVLKEFKDWKYAAKLIIASGGVRTGIDIAKSIALGASLAGIALPFVKASNKGTEAINAYLDQLRNEFIISMFCTGSENIDSLSKVRVISTPIT